MATRFRWDPAKAASNLRKHGISFETAAAAFADPFALTEIDDWSGGELRLRTFGCAAGFLIIVVVHTSHEDDENGEPVEIIRIISARKADRTERTRYEREAR